MGQSESRSSRRRKGKERSHFVWGKCGETNRIENNISCSFPRQNLRFILILRYEMWRHLKKHFRMPHVILKPIRACDNIAAFAGGFGLWQIFQQL